MRLVYLLVLLSVFSCNNRPANNGIAGQSQIQQIVKKSNRYKSALDSMQSQNAGRVMLFAKVNGQQNAVLVDDGEWPDDIEYRYNVMKDTADAIVRISTIKSDPNGNWDVECIHYFDEQGQTIAYEKRAGAFVLPKDGIAYETITDYFDPEFEKLARNYALVDKENKQLDKLQYAFTYTQIDTTAYPGRDECLKAYHIKP